jgi:DNA repair protein RadC
MAELLAIKKTTKILCPRHAIDAVAPIFFESENELLLIVCLDLRHEILSSFAAGSSAAFGVTGALRDIVVKALAGNATSILLAHNHPSGDPTPSRRDVETTRRLTKTLGALNIRLEDHLITGGGRWTSMRGLGLL